jgi:GAF domain-containing protein
MIAIGCDGRASDSGLEGRVMSGEAAVSAAATELRLLAEVSRSLATFRKLDDVVHFATRRTRELFDAEGCAVLLLDATRHEFYFPISSQREASVSSATVLRDLRFPADRGVAGWVLAHDESALVHDTANDPRFYDAIDHRTSIHTRALMCAPLRTRTGNIGVLEVVNPSADRLDPDALVFLDALATVVGVAYEKAALYGEIERELLDLRRFSGIAGLVLSLLGALLAVGSALYLRVLVLPWAELPARRGFLLGVVCLLIGGLLVGVGRGWIVPRRTAPAPQPVA